MPDGGREGQINTRAKAGVEEANMTKGRRFQGVHGNRRRSDPVHGSPQVEGRVGNA